MSIYYIFNSKEALQDEILSIALGSFKSKLSYKTAKSVSELNEHLMAAFKEVQAWFTKLSATMKLSSIVWPASLLRFL